MNQPGKQYRWLAVGLVLAATVLIAARLADTEPRFEDRKLSAWLDDPTLAETEIERGVRAIGTNAIPQLQSWLVQRPSLPVGANDPTDRHQTGIRGHRLSPQY